MMSVRGTMTSSTRRSRRLRMFLSILLSSGEKPVSAPSPSSSTCRSDRIEVGLQPNTARSRRLNQDSGFSRGVPPERRASPGKSRWPVLAESVSLVARAGLSVMALVSSIAADIGIGNAQGGQDLALQPLHPLGLVLRQMIVPQKM